MLNLETIPIRLDTDIPIRNFIKSYQSLVGKDPESIPISKENYIYRAAELNHEFRGSSFEQLVELRIVLSFQDIPIMVIKH